MKSKIISFIIIIIVTILVLFFSLKDDYSTILNTILNINKIWLLFSFLLLFGYYLFRSICIYKMASKFSNNYKLKNSFRLVLETNFFHAVTPFATGGQPYEIYALSKNDIKVADAISISIGNFIVYQIALVFLGFISIVCNYFLKIVDGSLLKNFIMLGFIINTSVIVILLMISVSKKTDKTIVDFFINILGKIKIIKNPYVMKNKFHNYLLDFNKGSDLLFKDKVEFIKLVLFQLISLISLYLIPLTLFIGIKVYDIKLYQDIITMSYVMLIGSFVPIPGGTGGLEYGFMTFFGKFIKNSKLNAIMLLWRFITYYFGMILGAVVLNVKKERVK